MACRLYRLLFGSGSVLFGVVSGWGRAVGDGVLMRDFVWGCCVDDGSMHIL